MNMIAWIVEHMFGIGKLEFMKNLDKDKLTTYLGFLDGLIKAASGPIMAGGWDSQNPVCWATVAWGVISYVKSWGTNKTGPTVGDDQHVKDGGNAA